MNIQEYIASGILEDYALGLLEDSAREEVRRMAEQHPEVGKELEEIESALNQYAMANAIPMPDGLQDRILEKIDDQEEAVQKPARSPKNMRLSTWLLTLLMLASLALCYRFFKSSEEAKAERTLMEMRLQDCEDAGVEVRRQLNILLGEANQSIILKGTADTLQSMAKVLYNPAEESAYLDVVNLDNPNPGKQYQVWALKAGQAISVGLINNQSLGNTIVRIDFVEEADGFAISEEDLGGKPQPTQEAIVALGLI